MASHEAQAYKEPGTPEEQSRRTFLANATVASGGIIGLILTVPLVGSLIPESLLKPQGSGVGGSWSDISADEVKGIEAATKTPIKVSFKLHAQDGYLPAADSDEFVWGVKLSPQMMENFKKDHPDLFTPGGSVPYPAFDKELGFAIFSPICPHLGCQFQWNAEADHFICPCHGSQFDFDGGLHQGPALRGLDPLPFREMKGQAQITWIRFKAQQPDRVIVSYS